MFSTLCSRSRLLTPPSSRKRPEKVWGRVAARERGCSLREHGNRVSEHFLGSCEPFLAHAHGCSHLQGALKLLKKAARSFAGREQLIEGSEQCSLWWCEQNI